MTPFQQCRECLLIRDYGGAWVIALDELKGNKQRALDYTLFIVKTLHLQDTITHKELEFAVKALTALSH